MREVHLEAIRNFEGFSGRGVWDYKQVSNGYGTRAKYAGEVIDPAEADRRFRAELEEAQAAVSKFAPGLDEGTSAALTSLTFNAGTGWMNSGLGAAVKRGDLDEVRTIFKQYANAGGERLPGLVARREAEACWIGNEGSSSARTAPGIEAVPKLQMRNADGPAGAVTDGLASALAPEMAHLHSSSFRSGPPHDATHDVSAPGETYSKLSLKVLFAHLKRAEDDA